MKERMLERKRTRIRNEDNSGKEEKRKNKEEEESEEKRDLELRCTLFQKFFFIRIQDIIVKTYDSMFVRIET